MLYYLAATLYVLTCFLLILVVLLQQGKGGDIANAFGGGASLEVAQFFAIVSQCRPAAV